MAENPLGMYGLRWLGLPRKSAKYFNSVEPDAPVVDVRLYHACSLGEHSSCTDDEVVLAFDRHARFVLRRTPAEAEISVVDPHTPETLVHPVLVVAAAGFNRWRGALTLHGGAFLAGGRAWAVVADKEGGKSTTMATLALRGVPVLADDLVVVLDGKVMPGPRSVDLRPGAVERLGVGRPIGVVAGRMRYRHDLGPADPAPLGGVIALEWSDGPDVRVESMGVEERLQCLARNEAFALMGPQPPTELFNTMTLPMYRLLRPRSWHMHEPALDALMDVTAEPIGGGATPAATTPTT